MIVGEKQRKLYERNKHKPNHEALCIPTEELHLTRLKTAAQMLNEQGVDGTILDIGAGFGHLLGFVYRFADSYVGVEQCQWMVEDAAKDGIGLVHDDGGTFLTNADDEAYDAVCLLGLLATMTEEEAKFILDEAWRVSKKGILVSYQDAFRYEGSFQSYSSAFFTFFDCPTVVSNRTDTEVTSWFPKP